ILLRDSAIDRLASPLPNQIAAALWPHPCRVYRSGGYIAAASRAIGHRAAMHRRAHLAAPERCALSRFGAYVLDKTCREHLARRTFARILGVAVLPTAFLVHAYNFISVRFFLAIFVQKRQRPSRSDGGCREKGVPSSGEKTVVTRNVAKIHCSAGAWLRPLLGIPR